MKKNLYVVLSTLSVSLLMACSTTSYYQIYKTTASSSSISKSNTLNYEDENCQIKYDFWQQGGNVGFFIYNKTDRNLYLNLDDSFFVINGIAHNYFKNRTFATSNGNAVSSEKSATLPLLLTSINSYGSSVVNRSLIGGGVSTSSTETKSISYLEDRIVVVPPKTSKIIEEYAINLNLYRDCDLLKYPSKKEISPKVFTKENSPFVFSNRLNYKLGDSGKSIKIENEFFVNEIANYSEKDIATLKNSEYCGEKSFDKVLQFNNASPEKFFIKYSKNYDYSRY